MSYKDKLFGELRSVLQRPPSEASWVALGENIERWPEDDLVGHVLTYAEDHLRGWPDALRIAPTRWHGRGARMSLCRRVKIRVHDDGYTLREQLQTWDLSAITELDLSGSPLGDWAVFQLIKTPGLNALRWLDLDLMDIGAAGLSELSRWPTTAQLHHLSLFQGMVDSRIPPAAYTAFVTSPNLLNLRHLSLCGHDALEDTAACALFSSPHLTHLTSLVMSFTNITHVAVEALVESPLLPRLTHLDLSECYFSDEAAIALASSPRVAGLTNLWIGSYAFTSRGADALASSPHLRDELRAHWRAWRHPEDDGP